MVTYLDPEKASDILFFYAFTGQYAEPFFVVEEKRMHDNHQQYFLELFVFPPTIEDEYNSSIDVCDSNVWQNSTADRLECAWFDTNSSILNPAC